MMTAVDFYSHHRKRFMKVEFRVSGIDLATQVFRAAYLDARNATYVAGPYEGPEPAGSRRLAPARPLD